MTNTSNDMSVNELAEHTILELANYCREPNSTLYRISSSIDTLRNAFLIAAAFKIDAMELARIMLMKDHKLGLLIKFASFNIVDENLALRIRSMIDTFELLI